MVKGENAIKRKWVLSKNGLPNEEYIGHKQVLKRL